MHLYVNQRIKMKITIEKLENRQKMTLNIEKFDVEHMQELKKEMQKSIEDNQTDVLVDLSNVSFVDSSGLSVLIALFKQLNGMDKKLTLCGLQEQPIELLEITQLNKVFTLIENCNA